MKGKVFILEDDESISGLVKVALEMNGLTVKAFSTLKAFIASLSEELPDVALLDIMLPDGSGLQALKHIKENYAEVDCIMLSAMSKEEDKVNGLNMGADDYVSKPFSVLELTARVNARLRKKQRDSVLTVGNIKLNTETMDCEIDGVPAALKKKEYELLKVLMQNAGKVLSREKLLNEVWGYDTGETRTLDNHVARLRKLGVKIETVFGVGYKL
ncbi:MAG: response regulator transcription factor [Candidatus Coproplasma sp.]